VRTGKMTSGPKGRIWGFPPYSRFIELFANHVWDLDTYPVEVRDGAIHLRG
jgi:3-phenylpropionate/trans-cinnamate dioxygenase ferredoxin component